MFVLADGDVLRLKDLPRSAKEPSRPTCVQIPSDLPLHELERAAVEMRSGSTMTTGRRQSAQDHRRTLQRKLTEFGEASSIGG